MHRWAVRQETPRGPRSTVFLGGDRQTCGALDQDVVGENVVMYSDCHKNPPSCAALGGATVTTMA